MNIVDFYNTHRKGKDWDIGEGVDVDDNDRV